MTPNTFKLWGIQKSGLVSALNDIRASSYYVVV